MSSSTPQSSKLPSGKYRRIVKGILRALSSFIAISRGSVSPSSSTITGAFMLICKARVPRMRARSYLVIYFVVWRARGVFSCFFSSPSPPTTSSGASSLFSGSSSTPSSMNGAQQSEKAERRSRFTAVSGFMAHKRRWVLPCRSTHRDQPQGTARGLWRLRQMVYPGGIPASDLDLLLLSAVRQNLPKDLLGPWEGGFYMGII